MPIKGHSDWKPEYAEARKERRRANKRSLVEYKGGKCCVCAYDKCAGALDFHHIGEKKFTIGEGNHGKSCLSELKEEADKTILVCKNCHAEIHAGMHENMRIDTVKKALLN
jgi:predicted HNH restriction endonuclease